MILKEHRTRIKHQTKYILQQRLFDACNAMCLLVWGLWVLIGSQVFTTAKAYTYLSAQEDIWGLWFLAIGLINFIALYKSNRKIYIACKYGALSTWSIVSTTIMLADPVNPIGPLYLILAIFTSLDILFKREHT